MNNHAETDRYVVPTSVTWDEIGGEIVAINLLTGHYHSLRGTARDVFVLIHAAVALDEVVTMLASPTDVTAEMGEAVRDFTAELVRAGLVRAAEVGEALSHDPSPPLGERNAARPWVAPVLETYTDLEDLMLLDPVHDVDAQGWPRAVEVDVDTSVDA